MVFDCGRLPAIAQRALGLRQLTIPVPRCGGRTNWDPLLLDPDRGRDSQRWSTRLWVAHHWGLWSRFLVVCQLRHPHAVPSRSRSGCLPTQTLDCTVPQGTGFPSQVCVGRELDGLSCHWGGRSLGQLRVALWALHLLCGSKNQGSWLEGMEKSSMRFLNSGDPSLLVWRIPAEISETGMEAQVYAFSLLSRPGGLLLALPTDVLKKEAVLNAMVSIEEDEFLGPSKIFETDLHGEEEDGSAFEPGSPCKFLVIDALDAVLPQLREYDPVTDILESILPFSEEHPNCVPKVAGLGDELSAWVEEVAFERLNFYSAREEQEEVVPKALTAGKKAAPKRAAVQPESPMLLWRIRLRPWPLRWSYWRRSTTRSLLPNLVDLQPMLALPKLDPWSQRFLDSPQGCKLVWFGSCKSDAIGGPSASNQGTRSRSCWRCGTAARGGYFIAHPGQRSYDGSAEHPVSSLGSIGVPSCWRRSDFGAGGLFFRPFNEYKRCCSSRKDADRTCIKIFDLLLADPTAALQKDESNQGLPKDFGGADQTWGYNDGLLGALWRIPSCKGDRSGALDPSALHGLCGDGRLRGHQRVPGTLCGSSGTERLGWELEPGLNHQLDGRPTSTAFCREDDSNHGDGKAFLSPHTPKLGCHKSSICQGARGPQQQEDRTEESRNSCSSEERRPKPSEPEEETQVPEASPGRRRSPSGQVTSEGCMGLEFKSSDSPGNTQHYDPGNELGNSQPRGAEDVRHGLKHRPSFLEMSYPRWCAMLTANVLKTRTPFAKFLSFTFALHRRFGDRQPSTPTYFPVPVVDGCHLHRMPKGCSAQMRRHIHLQRTVHCVCMALNFWHFGSRWPDERQLWREPNAEHRALFSRIRALIRSDGQAESFLMAKSGRKAPELIARLSELSTLLTSGGIGNNSYEKTFSGIEVPLETSCAPEINPFSDLNADRLRLFGRGHWDVTNYVSDDLKMAYRDPDSLLADLALGSHPKIRDSVDEVAKLAHLWDDNDVLYIHNKPCPSGSLVKIFNSYKNSEQDRQIGDRRGRNSLECRVPGPSKDLPAGSDLMELHVPLPDCKAVVAISDRRDYYHQIWVTRKRAASNAVGPGIPLSMVEDTKAYSVFALELAKGRKKAPRHLAGDGLHEVGDLDLDQEHPAPNHAWASFKSILQGDHCGVEIATSAHMSLLQDHGLLQDHETLRASRCLTSSTLAQGLVIDDFFAVSVESRNKPNHESKAKACYDAAQRAYSQVGLLGSPAKYVLAENEGKVIGAYVNSSDPALDRNLCTVGAPPQKRIALSMISLAMCQLAYSTDSLMLCLIGGWVAVLSFRRPLMSILDRTFHAVDQSSFDCNCPKLVPLSRKVANELVLLSVLAPLAVSDLGAGYIDKIFCSDASMSKGAICSTKVSRQVAQALWRSCRSKGSYTRLLTPEECLLKRLGELEVNRMVIEELPAPTRPLAYNYDFLEIYAGAAIVSDCMAEFGLVVGPPIDLGFSEEFNMEWVHVLEWVTFLIAEGRLRSLMISPPCTTFSQ